MLNLKTNKMVFFNFFKKSNEIDLEYNLFRERVSEKIRLQNEYKKTINYQFVEKLITKLENNPEYFTSRWEHENKVNKSIMSQDKIFHIMNNGDIISPIDGILLLEEQRDKIVQLVTEIIQKDKEFIMNKYLKFL